jgi:hypothetical protein
MLEATFQQAGLQDAVVDFEGAPGAAGYGAAHVFCVGTGGAQQCTRHFRGRQWGHGPLVNVQVCCRGPLAPEVLETPAPMRGRTPKQLSASAAAFVPSSVFMPASDLPAYVFPAAEPPAQKLSIFGTEADAEAGLDASTVASEAGDSSDGDGDSEDGAGTRTTPER